MHPNYFYRYKPAPEDQIMKAFEVLDQENKGYLTTEELTKYMSEEGIIYSNYSKIIIIIFTMALVGEDSW